MKKICLKKYLVLFIVLFIQIFYFYIYPIFAGKYSPLGMVIAMLLGTFLISYFLGAASALKIKFLYPVAVPILFLPTVFIFYNSSALMLSLWYLITSAIGLLFGSLLRFIIKFVAKAYK